SFINSPHNSGLVGVDEILRSLQSPGMILRRRYEEILNIEGHRIIPLEIPSITNGNMQRRELSAQVQP
ncbi:MAG TPA: hypothetical protein VMX56_01395, partial [Anaerolineales bacterium]|nr:hypothetical protein [Anaerolineales bacterium]